MEMGTLLSVTPVVWCTRCKLCTKMRMLFLACLLALPGIPAGQAQDIPADDGAGPSLPGEDKHSGLKFPDPEAELAKQKAEEELAFKALRIDGEVVRTVDRKEVNLCVAAVWKRGPNLFIYFRNPTQDTLEITKADANDVVLPYPPRANKREIAATGVLFCDLLPDPIPPGAMAELKVRLNQTALPFVSDTLVLRVQSKQGQVYEGTCPMKSAPRFEFTSYAFDDEFKTLHIYVHGEELAEITEVTVGDENLTSSTAVRKVADTGFYYLKVALPQPARWGEYRIVRVVSNLGLNLCAVKAIIPLFAIQLWGAADDGRPPSDEVMRDCAEHGFNSFESDVLLWGGPRALPLLSKYNLRGAGNRWSTTVHWGWASLEERCKELGDDERLLWWALVDEPTGGRYEVIHPQEFQKSWGVPYRKHTRQPSMISHTWYGDQSLFDYVDIAGVFLYCADGGQEGIPGLVEMLRSRVGHKPVVYIVQAYRRHGGPLPDPENERFMVYLAVAHGAKGISYFIYSPGWGLGGTEPETKKLWEGIGQINQELSLIGPLLWQGEPVPLASTDNAKVEVSAILCGEDTMALVALNHHWAAVSHPIENCRVRVKLPDWFKAEQLYEVSHRGLSKLDYENSPGEISLLIKRIQTTAVLVLTGDKDLFARMKEKLESATSAQAEGEQK